MQEETAGHLDESNRRIQLLREGSRARAEERPSSVQSTSSSSQRSDWESDEGDGQVPATYDVLGTRFKAVWGKAARSSSSFDPPFCAQEKATEPELESWSLFIYLTAPGAASPLFALDLASIRAQRELDRVRASVIELQETAWMSSKLTEMEVALNVSEQRAASLDALLASKQQALDDAHAEQGRSNQELSVSQGLASSLASQLSAAQSDLALACSAASEHATGARILQDRLAMMSTVLASVESLLGKVPEAG